VQCLLSPLPHPLSLAITQHPTRQEGIEPPTYSLEGCCSIQLSYWRLFFPSLVSPFACPAESNPR
jgi:hypothetical protein